jgi:hypothetical protein
MITRAELIRHLIYFSSKASQYSIHVYMSIHAHPRPRCTTLCSSATYYTSPRLKRNATLLAHTWEAQMLSSRPLKRQQSFLFMENFSLFFFSFYYMCQQRLSIYWQLMKYLTDFWASSLFSFSDCWQLWPSFHFAFYFINLTHYDVTSNNEISFWHSHEKINLHRIYMKGELRCITELRIAP